MFVLCAVWTCSYSLLGGFEVFLLTHSLFHVALLRARSLPGSSSTTAPTSAFVCSHTCEACMSLALRRSLVFSEMLVVCLALLPPACLTSLPSSSSLTASQRQWVPLNITVKGGNMVYVDDANPPGTYAEQRTFSLTDMIRDKDECLLNFNSFLSLIGCVPQAYCPPPRVLGGGGWSCHVPSPWRRECGLLGRCLMLPSLLFLLSACLPRIV